VKFEKKRTLKIAVTFLTIGILIGTMITYASNPSPSYLSGGIYAGAPSYTVFNEGSTYYAKNAYGAIDYSGINATTIIQNALDGLTSGRTWKEKVLLQGYFVITETIDLPSYVSIELDGNMTLADNTNKDMIECNTTVHTDWVGGVLSGNHQAQTSGKGMDLNNFCYGTIKNVFFYEFEESAIELSAISGETEGVIIHENVFRGNKGSAIKTESNVKDSSFCYNRMEDLTSFGIACTGLLTSIIGFNTISAEVQSGISLSSCNDNVVIGNDVDSCGQNGIQIVSSNLMPNSVVGNTLYNNVWHGIVIDDSNNTVVSDNICYTNGYDGINIQGASMFNVISGNICTDGSSPTQDYGIREQDTTDYNIITDNICLRNVNYGIKQVGSNTKVHNCWNGTDWIA